MHRGEVGNAVFLGNTVVISINKFKIKLYWVVASKRCDPTLAWLLPTPCTMTTRGGAASVWLLPSPDLQPLILAQVPGATLAAF